ncbi:tellurite resistance/C4-dicarboxylate transporter family protein [Thiothrix lacustris]|uniref:tellurite resistance/C4-dicarboxylate transporter family protein n=1 Tax=Thiothrix lacustris TaxID=525917 RepID=UPI0027E5B9E5|nr:tellurite resistance/C4-dicarboxylate transporter family protein [Thiothrix lacustris]WMP17762.1 tellurite resistance/C4-dicarboxylate transporter family protein [Thiothrix lacustris]
MLDDASRDQSLRWLEGLPPGYFALVMATGILAIAFQMIGQLWLYEAMSVLTGIFWVVLLLLSAWRLLRFPHAVKIDLLNIRRVFAFFTLVVATNIVGILFHQHGYPQLAMACWVMAFLSWSALLYLSFSVLTFLTHPHTVNVVHGDWLSSITGTQSLVLLGLIIAPDLGEYADYMLVEVHLLWMLGLVFYGIFITLFCYRIFFKRFQPEDTSPLLWVITGAAAVGTNAGTGLLNGDVHLTFLLALHPFIDGMVMLMWAWATWWIPMLIIFGVWKHFVRRYPIAYEPAMWSMVFPLGMYAVASFRLGLAAEFPPLGWISYLMVWVAFAVWCLTLLGWGYSWFKQDR